MGRNADSYWDVAEARWVPSPAPRESDTERVVPAQRTGLAEAEEADVPSR